MFLISLVEKGGVNNSSLNIASGKDFSTGGIVPDIFVIMDSFLAEVAPRGILIASDDIIDERRDG